MCIRDRSERYPGIPVLLHIERRDRSRTFAGGIKPDGQTISGIPVCHAKGAVLALPGKERVKAGYKRRVQGALQLPVCKRQEGASV